jgi:hypothetical protein
MTAIPAASELAPAELEALRALLARDALDILRADAHLFALLPPRDGIPWQVDLERGEFVSTIGEPPSPHVRAAAQLIATWSTADGTWLWGDANPSVGTTAASPALDALAALPEIAALRAHRRFALAEADARGLATWCAIRTGRAGAWPSPTARAIAFLALEPTVWPDGTNPTTDRMWCSMCGRARTECAKLIAGPGVNICNECIQLLADIMAESSDDGPPPPDFMPPCLFCGGRERRVFGATGAVCRTCADLMVDVVRG